jgi:hypothetical protein
LAIIIILILFIIAIFQLIFRWLKNWQPPKRKEKAPKRQKSFDLLDFDEFADIMDEEDGEE